MGNTKSKIILEKTEQSLETIRKMQYYIEEIDLSLHSKVDKNGFFNMKFEARLLESVLLSAYYKHFHYGSEMHKSSQRMVQNVYDKTIHSTSSTPALDLNIQRLLYELFQEKYNDSEDHLKYWYNQYQAILNECFKEDLEQNRMKKMLFFDLVAFCCSPNKEVQNCLYKIIMRNFTQILPYFQASFQKEVKSHWNQIYPLLFQLITFSFGRSSYTECLQEIMKLQSFDGTWFQNNTLTLIVLHIIRKEYDFNDMIKEIISEGIKRVEFYLYSYKDHGMSIISSMSIFNTVLFYSQKSFFVPIELPDDLVKSLGQFQKDSGGWTSDILLQFTDWDVSGFAMVSIILDQRNNQYSDHTKVLKKALDYFYLAAREDGSFAVYVDGSETLAEMTARGIMVLSLIPPKFISEDDRFDMLYKSFKWLDETQQKNGLYSDQSYSSSKIYPLSQVALAILYTLESPYLNHNQRSDILPIITRIKNRIIQYLHKSINPNGSYSPRFRFPLSGEQQSTSYAVIALATLDNGSKYHLAALKHLLSTISLPVQSFPEGTGPRPIRYNDQSHGSIFVYIAFLSSLYGLRKSSDSKESN